MEKDIIVNIPTGTRKNYYKPGLYVTNIMLKKQITEKVVSGMKATLYLPNF